MSQRDDDERKDKERKATDPEREQPQAPEPDDEDEDDEDDDEPESKPAARAKGSAAARSAPTKPPATSAAKPNSTPLIVAVVLALAAGGAGGWFGQQAQAKSKIRAEVVAPAPSGSGAPAGPCGTWQTKICTSTGETSAACGQAKGAVDLLTPSSCEAALLSLPGTLAHVKAARASCDTLQTKLCKDLPEGSPVCDMVKQQTPSFPPKRCEDMLKHYDQVIANLKQMAAQPPPQMGAPH